MTIYPILNCYFKNHYEHRRITKPKKFTEQYINDLGTKMDFFMQIKVFPFLPTIGNKKNVSTRLSVIQHFLHLVTSYHEGIEDTKMKNEKVHDDTKGKSPQRKQRELISNTQKVIDDLNEYRVMSARDNGELNHLLEIYIEELEKKAIQKFSKDKHFSKRTNHDSHDNKSIGSYLETLIKRHNLQVTSSEVKDLIDFI